MKTRNITKTVYMIAIAALIALLFAVMAGTNTNAADSPDTYPNGKTEEYYSSKEAEYLAHGLKSKGTFVSDDVELHAADFYYLYDISK